jgi:glycosyltransferase involved in cell wall biosynthesis
MVISRIRLNKVIYTYYMSVSICIPTYNRKRFEKLIEFNINCQTYKNIKEVIIADDGDDELVLDIIYPINYIKIPKRITIGAKRNLLACQAKGEYICHMDTDDIYHPSYISYGMQCLMESGKNIFGSIAMLITFPTHEWKICASVCNKLYKANEATFIYKKSFWKEGRFGNTSQAEGQPFLKGRDQQFFSGDIEYIMVCIAHTDNTVSKQKWLKNEIPECVYPRFEQHKKIYLDYIECQIKQLAKNLMLTSP